jgi:hypothetical protein
LPALAGEITRGTFQVDARPVPLADVESAWTAARGKERLVLTMGQDEPLDERTSRGCG